MWLRTLDGAPTAPGLEGAGSKAESLQVLRAAGLPVPDGFVLTDAAFRAVLGGHAPQPNVEDVEDVEDVEQLGQALEQLAARIEHAEPPAALAQQVSEAARALAGAGALAVRSSISLEDRGAGAAAGVFSSRLEVSPAEVWPAIRAVWASVCTPLAAAYARHQALASAPRANVAPLQVAVIIQRFAPGQRLTVYTRLPGQPSSPMACVERGPELRKLPRAIDQGAPTAADADAALATAALTLALRAEHALALQATGADVELIAADDGTLAVVQARAIVHPSFATKVTPPPIVTAGLVADGRRWLADLAHNPDPLSPAQAGLIELIERERASPYELRLCAGYLYTTPREGEVPTPAAPSSARELRQRFAELEARAAEALGAPCVDDLAATLAAYTRMYRIWAFEMSPLVSAARRAGGPAWAPPGARPSAVEAQLLACARGELGERELLEHLGELSAAWDVAAPSLAETPGLLAAAVERLRTQHGPPRADAPDARAPADPSLSQTAAELAEADDHWFARAQTRVRHALLRLGRALELGDDIFWIPLAEALDAAAQVAAGHRFDPGGARARASAARAAHRRASAWRMPALVGGEVTPARRWHGVGCGGVVTGRVRHVPDLWRLWDGAGPLSAGAQVIVVPAVTPALAVALVGATAIISETGGLLDHGAAMARELGIPCVVGCAEAMSLPPHALVEVHGDDGVVRLLTPGGD